VISEIASISDKDEVGNLFLDTIKKLLAATKAVNAQQVDDSSMEIEDNSNTNSMMRFHRVHIFVGSYLCPLDFS
jgi:ribosomal RNA-processing protein 12